MKIYGTIFSATLVFILCLAVGGCVHPGVFKPDLVSRYQEELSSRGAGQRMDDRGLDLLRPASTTAPPGIQIDKDPKTQGALINLSLQEAITAALQNNPDIRVVSFSPAIARQEMVKATAQFDYIIFGEYGYTKVDERPLAEFFGGQSKVQEFKAGLREKTVTGAEWSLSWTFTRTWDDSSFARLRKRYEPRLMLEVTQPLLRDAWPKFNLASVRLARTNYKTSLAQFQQNAEEILLDVISAYWTLWRTKRDVKIQVNLLKDTLETLGRLKARADLDATAVQIKQAEAAVQNRRVALDLAEKQLKDARDELGRLVADESLNTIFDGSVETTTSPTVKKVTMDTSDQLLSALTYSPALRQARLGIESADINIDIAENQTLPRLDISASTQLHGLGESPDDSYHWLYTGNYLGYSMSMLFEYPIGNREREAQLRLRRLERRQAISQLQATADRISQTIRERIREIHRTFEKIKLQRDAVAATEKELQAIEDIERIRGRLTPEFLQLKLNTQERLAIAKREELAAIEDYNIAMAQLARTKGTLLEQYRLLVPPAGAEEE